MIWSRGAHRMVSISRGLSRWLRSQVFRDVWSSGSSELSGQLCQSLVCLSIYEPIHLNGRYLITSYCKQLGCLYLLMSLSVHFWRAVFSFIHRVYQGSRILRGTAFQENSPCSSVPTHCKCPATVKGEEPKNRALTPSSCLAYTFFVWSQRLELGQRTVWKCFRVY